MCIDELKKSFNDLSPATTFLVGFVGAVLIFCTIGFFVLLGFLIKGEFSFTAKTNEAAVVGNTDQQESLTEPAGTVTPLSKRDHVRGAESATVTLIEYSDFECPFCKNFHTLMKQLLSDYSGKIKWAYRHFPLGFHANAQKEAEAAECAYDLGGHDKFWQFADTLYERTTSNGTGFALTDLPKLAGELGLNKTEFSKCLDSGKNKNFVETSLQEGEKAGIQGTPGIIMIDARGGERLIKGAYPIDVMKQIIDGAF